MTSEQIQAAMNLWKEKNQTYPEPEPPGNHSDNSGDSQVSIFDRIKKNLKRPTEDARIQLKKKAIQDKIQKDEEAKARATIEKRIQEEEKKLEKTSKHVTLNSSDSEPEKESKQELLARALRDLKRKEEGDTEIGPYSDPLQKESWIYTREEGLKHFNFDSFDSIGDPEEHLNYFEQTSNIYYYNDLTRCHFFALTLKGGA